ncbi:uncharacterized protein LOC130782300 isoform X1 [Actinidia eriantha]|uniref:uncharacterized protein LOC130782300 isoform X1 n=1 Tax=Actinidia eriantha TaxID=165200 RepID=UPI002583D244|nr:uncharacterized protein LOC130782300 isoform X1 [Actinidia eriantha]XP_057497556.1 uncharacterized protein LOC130782300 isoform X1 [Actinidia eriantha]
MATIMNKVEETRVDSKSINPNISISPCTNRSFLLYNRPPFTPFLWPIIHSSNPLQLHGSQSPIIPSEVSMPNIANPVLFHEQENPRQTNAPSTPVYVLPFPWFVPVPDHGNESSFKPSFDLNDYQSRASSSSKTTAFVEKHHSLLPSNVKGGASSSVSPVPANNLFETPFGFVPDGGGQCKELHPQVLVLMPAQLNSTRPTSTAKNKSDHRPDYIPGAQVFSSAVDQAVNAFSETRQDLNTIEKQADSNAAAGARKRTKELKKLRARIAVNSVELSKARVLLYHQFPGNVGGAQELPIWRTLEIEH